MRAKDIIQIGVISVFYAVIAVTSFMNLDQM